MLTNNDKFCSKVENVYLLKSFKINSTVFLVINNLIVDNFSVLISNKIQIKQISDFFL